MSPSQTPTTITKRELTARIANETGLKKTEVRDVIQRFLDGIRVELEAGNRLEFREFGVFEVKERAARKARNPRTRQEVLVPSKMVVTFKAGRSLRERVQRAADRRDSKGNGPSGPRLGEAGEGDSLDAEAI